MEETSKVIVFQVGMEEYAIPLSFVTSIEKLVDITPIPHLPNYVRGIVRARGELIPIIDLETIFYNQLITIDETARSIILQTDELAIGILVKETRDIVEIPAEKLKQVGLVAYNKTKYFSGVANLEKGLITLVDPQTLVQSLEGIKEIQEFMKSQK